MRGYIRSINQRYGDDMKLRKGKWVYEITPEIYGMLSAHLVTKHVHFAIQYVPPAEIAEMHAKDRELLLGNVSYIALDKTGDKTFLSVYPAPHKAAELKIMATKVFEI